MRSTLLRGTREIFMKIMKCWKFTEITQVHPGSSGIIPSGPWWSLMMPKVILGRFWDHQFFDIFRHGPEVVARGQGCARNWATGWLPSERTSKISWSKIEMVNLIIIWHMITCDKGSPGYQSGGSLAFLTLAPGWKCFTPLSGEHLEFWRKSWFFKILRNHPGTSITIKIIPSEP